MLNLKDMFVTRRNSIKIIMASLQQTDMIIGISSRSTFIWFTTSAAMSMVLSVHQMGVRWSILSCPGRRIGLLLIQRIYRAYPLHLTKIRIILIVPTVLKIGDELISTSFLWLSIYAHSMYKVGVVIWAIKSKIYITEIITFIYF